MEYLIFIVMIMSQWLTAYPTDIIHGKYDITGYHLGADCFIVGASPYPLLEGEDTYWDISNSTCSNEVGNLTIDVSDQKLNSFCAFSFVAYDYDGDIIKEGLVSITNPYYSGNHLPGDCP